MTLAEVIRILEAEVLIGNHDDDEDVPRGGAADLMSDVLAFGTEGMVLMTGLTNPQVVRTSEMAAVRVIVFVRGKNPPHETLELAEDLGLTMLRTGYTMFEACGRLFAEGLPGRGPVNMEDDSW